MKTFAALYRALDASTSNRAKLDAMQAYLRAAPPEDAAWAVYFLAGGKPRQLVPTKLLRELTREAADLPEWLFDECYHVVGDLAETISLLLPESSAPVARSLAEWMRDELLPLRGLPPDTLRERLLRQWRELDRDERLPYFKLMTGSLRVGVSKLQVTQALAAVADVDAKQIAQRLMGYTQINARPSAAHYAALISPQPSGGLLCDARGGQPYPFFLAHPFNASLADFDTLLGTPDDWQIEWKWDGIRAQLVRRDDGVWIWTRGEELATERFPELEAMGQTLPPGTVLDGEILVWIAPASTTDEGKNGGETTRDASTALAYDDSTEGPRELLSPASGGEAGGEGVSAPNTPRNILEHPLPNPGEAPSQSTKPASGQVAGYLPLAGEGAQRANGQSGLHAADSPLAGDAALAVLEGVQSFAALQKRIGRKTLGAKILREQPLVMMVYDVLEIDGIDVRHESQQRRRERLEALVAAHPHPALHLSPLVRGDDWAALARTREAARRLGTEGFMLKRRDAAYGVGRTKAEGLWWKWKTDPLSVDAVLVYAQRGHGRRATLYSDYTFAVWSGPPDDAERTLVPFAKAYSGLTDDEMRQVDGIVRKTIRESFGPVRSVEPTMVFELGFEGIARSPRHKSGIAVRFPRILRWRSDKPVAEADTLESLQALLSEARA